MRWSLVLTSCGSEGERRASKRSWTALETLFTFCPPGPEARIKLSSSSPSFSQMRSVTRIMAATREGAEIARKTACGQGAGRGSTPASAATRFPNANRLLPTCVLILPILGRPEIGAWAARPPRDIDAGLAAPIDAEGRALLRAFHRAFQHAGRRRRSFALDARRRRGGAALFPGGDGPRARSRRHHARGADRGAAHLHHAVRP